ncbi:hypothetical protein HON22_03810 [Candidatus Peregrinibacteria bacterium]|jgi:hypothetical protein|nr:hypothetical protein [Candidatus Peregrinibacteria bacterium]
MDDIYEEIQDGRLNIFHKSFPLSIRDLRGTVSETLDTLNEKTSSVINSFADVYTEFEADYIGVVRKHLQSFLKKIS